jgi:hypothetical protein
MTVIVGQARWSARWFSQYPGMENSQVTVTRLPTPLDLEKLDPDQPATLRVMLWSGPAGEDSGIHPRSLYVEKFWLPVLGPSITP